MTVIASLANGHPWTRTLQSKVPEVVPRFWVLTLLGATLGPTAADATSADLGLGLTATCAVMSLFLVGVLIVQLSTRRCHLAGYWLALVWCTTVGVLLTDTLARDFGVSLWVVVVTSGAGIAVTFVVWHRVEHTVSFHSLLTRRREACYWTAVILAGSLGSSGQDLVTRTLGVGPAATTLIFALVLAGVIALAGAGAATHTVPVVAAFWSAYVLIWPLAAALADLLTAAAPQGGVGLSRVITTTSLVVLVVAGLSLHSHIPSRSRPGRSRTVQSRP